MAVEITGLYLQQSLNVAKGNDCWASAGADAAQAGFSISPCLGFFAITLCFSQHLSSALLALLPPPASSRGYSLGSVLSPLPLPFFFHVLSLQMPPLCWKVACKPLTAMNSQLHVFFK